jgi:cytochrome c55X
VNKIRYFSLTTVALIYIAAVVPSPQPSAERQQQLRQVVAKNCSVCHGPTLQGGVGPALNAKTLAGKKEDFLVTTILDGREGTVMPSWNWMLEESDARWLLSYIRSGEI